MTMQDINEFHKRHDCLICIDSDGTAIDAMNAKHKMCHGPSLIREWGLEDHAATVQTIWNEINLFSASRGVNRFIALVQMLERIDGRYLGMRVSTCCADGSVRPTIFPIRDSFRKSRNIRIRSSKRRFGGPMKSTVGFRYCPMLTNRHSKVCGKDLHTPKEKRTSQLSRARTWWRSSKSGQVTDSSATSMS